MMFRIKTQHQVLTVAAAKLHTNLIASVVLLFLMDYILLDFEECSHHKMQAGSTVYVKHIHINYES